MFRKLKPEDVFTPRSAVVNKSMYVHRAAHEREIKSNLRSGYNFVIFGDSGCGKSWLYKQVFDEEGVFYVTIDLTMAHSRDDVDLLLLEAIEGAQWAPSEKETVREGGVNPGGIGGRAGQTTKYEYREESAFFRLIRYMQKESGNKRSVLVFENLEYAVAKDEVVEAIRFMLLSLDDERVGRKAIQICLVGVPTDIKEVITKNNIYQTLSNRVVEVPEVARMSKAEAEYLVRTGFQRKLGLDIEHESYCISQIVYFSDRIPQYIHDICLQAAFIATDFDDEVNPGVIQLAAYRWIDQTARQDREFVRDILGRITSRPSQKNRVLFAIGKCEKRIFFSSDIEELLRSEFPHSVGSRKIQVLQVLNSLCNGEHRILKADEKLGAFRVVNTKLRSVIRCCIQKESKTESVLFVSDEFEADD